MFLCNEIQVLHRWPGHCIRDVVSFSGTHQEAPVIGDVHFDPPVEVFLVLGAIKKGSVW